MRIDETIMRYRKWIHSMHTTYIVGAMFEDRHIFRAFKENCNVICRKWDEPAGYYVVEETIWL